MKNPALPSGGRLVGLAVASLCLLPAAHAAQTLHYSFDTVDPTFANPNVTNSAPGATVNGTVMNPDKLATVEGNIVAVGATRYNLGRSLEFTSLDADDGATAGHVDTGISVNDAGIATGTTMDRNFTAMAWAYFADGIGDNMIFGTTVADERLHLGSRNGFYHSGHWGDDIGPDQGVNIATGTGSWHHVAFVNEGSSQSVFRDGVLIIGPGATGTSTLKDDTLRIGTSGNAGSFVGRLDEVKVFGDQAMTEAEILAEMSAGLPVYTLAVVSSAVLSATTYTFQVTDSATSVVDLSKTKSLQIDGADVTTSATFAKAGGVTTVTYTPTPAPEPGSPHTYEVRVTDNGNASIIGSGSVHPPYVSNIAGNGSWTTEHVWTQGSPTMSLGTAEEALNDPSVFPQENSIITKTQYIHFHDDVGPPLFVAESTPYPLWDPVNGGAGFGNREDFAIRCRGQIKIVKAGMCWFVCNSDDGFSLRIDGTEVGSAGDRARGNSVISVDLTAGVHEVEFVHWERGGGAGVSVYVYKGVTDTEPPFDEEAYELLQAFLDPTDTDGDGMPDSYEIANGLNPAVNDAALDKDGDGLTNLVESQRNTRADKADTDDDGLNDKIESGTGTFVDANDTGTNPRVPDTDGDSLKDGVETNTGIFVSATNTGTSPFKRDTDADGILDAGEIAKGTNPSVPNTGFNFGLVAYWPLDDNFNSTVNGHTATANGTDPIPFAPGKFGNAIKLDGNDQFLQVDGDENVFDFSGGQNLTISAWFTADAIDTDWQCLIAKGEGEGWRIHRRGADQPPEMAFAGGAGDVPKHNIPLSVGEDKMHHVIGISESGVNERLYFDGELVATGGAPFLENRPNPMRIGSNPDTTPGRFWEGKIDDVAIWCRVLTVPEIEQVWNQGQGRSIQQLLGPATSSALKFTQVLYNQATNQFTLSWTSSPGKTYTLNYSTDLAAFTSTVSSTIPSGGATTTHGPFPNPVPAATQIFFKAKEN